MKDFQIGNCVIGADKPVFFLAEIGLNHNGDVDLACEMIKSAARAGADGVKFQTYRAETLADPIEKPELYRIFKKAELDRYAFYRLKKLCDNQGVLFISTPFDFESVEVLIECDIPAFKIASGDLTNDLLLAKVASYGRPVIMSTGMGYMDEVIRAVAVLEQNGCEDILPLHCVSNYPPDDSEANLRAINQMRYTLDLHVGFSDHFIGPLATIGAVLLGAVLIEKHFTIDKNLEGPDQKLSCDEKELKAIIEQVRRLEVMLGSGEKSPSPKEVRNRANGRQGIYAAVDIPKGTQISKGYIKISRPEGRMPVSRILDVIGRRAKCVIPKGTSLSDDLLENMSEVLVESKS